MPQRRKQPQTESQEASEVLVPSRDAIIHICQAAIKKVVDLDWLYFHEVDSPQADKIVVRLRGAGDTPAVAQYTYAVVPILETTRGLYWLGASLDFLRRTHKTYLTHISLLIFEGLATDERKRPILRVEWDCRTNYRADKHAQPHWHIYPSRVNREIDRRSSTFQEEPVVDEFPTSQKVPAVEEFLGPEEAIILERSPISSGKSEDEDDNPSAWSGGEMFHFALAARWQGPPDREPQNEVLHVDQLGNWIQRCLTYIRIQLKYIDDRQ
jgi:hypothetical protein